MSDMIRVSSHFDGGNIEFVDQSQDAAGQQQIRLRIRPDGKAAFLQWFYYRVTGAKHESCQFVIENAGQSSYPDGWRDYRALASYDRLNWFRVDSDYEQGQLRFRHRPAQDSVFYAYFVPYSLEQHQALIAASLQKPGVRLDILGASVDGHDLDCLILDDFEPRSGLGADRAKLSLWVIGRQHPGETMASWWMEGFLARLTDAADPVARILRAHCRFFVVPLVNPDGAQRGHLRTNAAGLDLNRQWGRAQPDLSPEIFHILRKMNETGVDIFLDVHGDEALPYNFIAGGEGAPAFTPQALDRLTGYKDALMRASPDFQKAHGYKVDAPGTANLHIATNYMTQTFGCLAMTLEMPFKDNADLPDPIMGWSKERSVRLGAANLDAMLDWWRNR